MIDMFQQEWTASIENRDIFQNYRRFKSLYQTELYHDFVSVKRFRDCLVRLRLGVLPLKGAAFKSNFLSDDVDRSCFCGAVEDEKHFICECPLYVDIRDKYLAKLFPGPLCNFYIEMIKCSNQNVSRKLGMYISHALNPREIFVEANLNNDENT